MKATEPRPTAGAAGSAALGARLPQVVAIVAAAALAAELATVLWTFIPGARRPVPTPAVPPPPPAANLNGLLAAHLFGTTAADVADGADAPRTNVPLVLAGTLAVRDPKAGLAIIGESAQTGHVYAVGATLPGGVRLHEVYTDRVVLDRGGALESLPLPRAAGGAARPARVAGAEPPLGETVQKLINGGPEVVGEVLRPMPSYNNGKLAGFRVYAGRDRRKFARLGLQPGDVVTQVNGVPLGDAQHGLDALRTLGGAGTATVTVERGGGTQQLTIDASQLSGLGEGAPPPPPSAPQGAPVPGAIPPPPPTSESPPNSD
jgi:general secretion pathway protein C